MRIVLKKLWIPVILCLALLTSLPLQGFKTEPVSALGNTVTDFSLPNVDGKNISLPGYKKAKGFIIVFSCNRCPFAKLYTKRLNDLNAKYKALGVPLLCINSMDTAIYEEESSDKMLQRSKEEKFNFPYLHDALQTVAKQFNANHTPEAYIIWKENNIWKIEYSGSIDDNGAEPGKVTNHYLANAVNELLRGKHVSQPETRSVGCTIAYRK